MDDIGPVPSKREVADRQIGDPAADAVIAELSATSVLQLFARLRQQSAPALIDVPEPLRELVASASGHRFDDVRCARGQLVFARFGPELMLSLCAYSLPADYLNGLGAEALAETGALLHAARRRFSLTAQAIIDLLTPGGLGPEGRVELTALSIRLKHAIVRRRLLEGAWDRPRLGVPINQEDLAWTHLGFTHLPLQSLAKLGHSLSLAEVDGYFELWRRILHGWATRART